MKVGSKGKRNWTKFKKGWAGNIGGLCNVGSARNPPLTMTQKELLWKKERSGSLAKILETTCKRVRF